MMRGLVMSPTPAVLSLVALLAVIVASLFSRLNVGVLAVALAWPVALYGAGWKADALIQTFPSSLFLTLLGVSLLFGAAQTNGTMESVTRRAVQMCRGRAALVPPLVFLWRPSVLAPFPPPRSWRRRQWRLARPPVCRLF